MKPYSPGELAAIYQSYLDEKAYSGSSASAITTIAGNYGKEAGQYCYDREYAEYYDKQNPSPAQTSKPKSNTEWYDDGGLKPGEWSNISYDVGKLDAKWENAKAYDAEVAKALKDAKAAAAKKEYDSQYDDSVFETYDEKIAAAATAAYKYNAVVIHAAFDKDKDKETYLPLGGVKAVDPQHIKEERYYVYCQGTSNKFWNISINGLQTTTHWGRVGTAGTYQAKVHASRAAIDKIIAEKVAKGYVSCKTSAGAKSISAAIAPWSTPSPVVKTAPESEKPTKEIDPDRPKRKFIFST